MILVGEILGCRRGLRYRCCHAAIAMDRSMTDKLAKVFSAAALAALVSGPLLIRAQTLPPTPNPTADAQDSMVLARQGLMEGIYQYMEDAEDWTEQSPGANDAAMLQALTREAAHMALVLPALRQLFPPSTNPESPEFASRFDTYALPGIWAEPDGFAVKLDATIAAINVLAMARDRAEFAKGHQALQATCDACHDRFRKVYVSPFDTK
jgi:cytochrome c556